VLERSKNILPVQQLARSKILSAQVKSTTATAAQVHINISAAAAKSSVHYVGSHVGSKWLLVVMCLVMAPGHW
jgi:hypothetical protein